MADFRLSTAAQADIIEILAQTHERFGELARLRYEYLLVTALRDLVAEPDRIGSISCPELGNDVRSYHLRHSRDRARHESGIVRRPRHLLLFRLAGPDLIGVGRVLHDAMEIERHLPSDYGDE
ncbi:Plasmid stabilization system protein [Agrobacterium tumefaciens str. Cherry 2E-2-2]|uniref:Plasmid stabilization system protein n=1 Tax=Agrobacterium deltaense Zutra 3/1 TaxID=1183427 RepID=A0A1S7R7M1_9HYPH|nr:type II toxin-antitoxin system RelE/ParE family toxin [Agrobacterium deltaense]EMS96344.1 Plasmid stabilization system protein [Agrobacterium tumefaciens str. Cherry 2E-2-2]CUX48082.1 Plasmid stabilization system protein [Agrobacterium deltaense Zutra 3/1]